MNADASIDREPLHERRIAMSGYRRSDGLYEVEGHLLDTKPHPFTAPGSEHATPAGHAIHDMGVRLVFDDTMRVVAVQTSASALPYAPCWMAGGTLQCLVGLNIGAGWNKEVRRLLSGVQSCTHLMELLGPMATTALQSMVRLRMSRPDPVDAEGRPRKIDSCFAYAADREVVMRRWPEHAKARS